MPITIKIAICLEIAGAWDASTGDGNVIDGDVTAAALSTEYVIVPTFFSRSSSHVSNGNILDRDPIGRVAGWATIEVVLLNINTIDGNVGDGNVFKEDVGNETSRVRITLDACTVLSVEHDGVGEGYVCDIVIWAVISPSGSHGYGSMTYLTCRRWSRWKGHGFHCSTCY